MKKGHAILTKSDFSSQRAAVDMKGAVQAAFAFATDMFPEAKDIRLEEVEARSGGWSVVISFTTGEPGTLSLVMGGVAPRLFKTIAIDSETGQAFSLKVWKQ
jgi:hypothetical protein